MKTRYSIPQIVLLAAVVAVGLLVGAPALAEPEGQLAALSGLAVVGQMSPSGARVIDPILSEVARGYRHPQNVGRFLFPRVPVMARGGQIIEFGKESFKLYRSRRAPGGATKRVEIGYLGKPFSLKQDALEGKVPWEYLQDANQVPGIDMGTRATRTVMSSLELELEYDQAQKARDANNYDAANTVSLTGSDVWSGTSATPTDDIEAGKDQVRARIGMYANTVLLSAQAYQNAKTASQVVDRFKYTSSESITTDMLANLWDVDRVVVGKAVTYDEASDAMSDVWGPDVVVAYVPESPSGMEEPSYGYTYTMEGHPLVEEAYQDRNAKSWLYPTTYERDPVIAGAEAGFLIQGAGN